VFFFFFFLTQSIEVFKIPIEFEKNDLSFVKG